MSALDILDQLAGADVNTLPPLQRMLLINDGTLTEILEATFLERIELVKVAQNFIPLTASHGKLYSDSENETVMERKILLRGIKSGKNYAYAELLIATGRLAPSFRDGLVQSNTPLGRLWLEHRLETFKEIQEVKRQNAGDLSAYFKCAVNAPLLVRTYLVFTATKSVMSITEYFPTAYDI